MQRKIDWQWISISIALSLFSLFLLFKIHGYFDFSASFGIYKITGMESHNLLLLIDRDPLSTWGVSSGIHRQGEQIIIEFRKPRTLSQIEITNSSSEPTKEINISVSLDGTEYFACDYSTEVAGNVTKYILSSCPPPIIFVQLEYNEKTDGVWPISEVRFYE